MTFVPTDAFVSENQRAEVLETPYARQLTAGGGKPGQGYPMVRQVVAFHEDQRSGAVYETGHTHALGKAGGKPGQGYQAVRIEHAVRRLMPVECERLQGLPDGWTDLGATADSKRYAALGDAVTATVSEWLGRRLIIADATASSLEEAA